MNDGVECRVILMHGNVGIPFENVTGINMDVELIETRKYNDETASLS